MKKVFLFIFIVFSFSIFAKTSLKERLKYAQPNDYVVTIQNQFYSLLIIREINDDILLLEEICIPTKIFKQLKTTWKEWAKKGAQGHNSWMVYEIDLKNNHLLSCYSVLNHSYLSYPDEEQFFIKLLQLPLEPLPYMEKRKLGPDEMDRSLLSTPQSRIEGVLTSIPTKAYIGTWPDDNSDFANKTFTIYFDQENKYAFPCFIRISKSHLPFIFRMVDLGHNLYSSLNYISYLTPQFSNQKEDEEMIILTLTPSFYFKNFKLFLIDNYSNPKKIIPIPFTQVLQNHIFSFQIEKSKLKELLEKDHHYFWLAISDKNKNINIEDKTHFFLNWKG